MGGNVRPDLGRDLVEEITLKVKVVAKGGNQNTGAKKL